ncbi:MAG: DUF2157 domain-containing protein [Micavibrio aeruginosavorus]|uniref:DUF2157 domain-containing protein n=1 Tax=Micavibrio aeruginosavorus TaxID=349221 RepID=A0A7T5R4B2_9BACT|nr:MAG: DUF2157 domain-containing protein [Micavibrio aeruginosavorus]
MNPQTKEQALDLISRLSEEFNLGLDDIGARLTKDAAHQKGEKWLPRVLGYLGAAFIFCGLALFISMKWDDLNSPARVIITYGPGLMAFVLGIITLKDERFIRASTPLFLKSALLLPTGMFVYLQEYAEGDDSQLAALIVFGLLAMQFIATFKVFPRTSLLFFGFLFWNASVGILMDRANVPGDALGIGLGLSIMATAWSMDTTVHRPIAPFFYFLGSVGLLWSVFDAVEGTPADVGFLAAAVGMMFLSVRMHSRTLLIVSTFSLLGYLGYFTGEYFADTIGWPVALMLMGFMLIAISYWAVKLGRQIKAAQIHA